MRKREQWDFWLSIAKYVLGFFVAVMFILFLRYLAKTVSEAMNPPVPALEQFGFEEPVEEAVPEDLKKTSEILERVEMLTREEPVNIASIIRQWLMETQNKPKAKK
jgi:flagellar biosynthesis/type III secretory pathway M-ring protein FliF/YscJ